MRETIDRSELLIKMNFKNSSKSYTL